MSNKNLEDSLFRAIKEGNIKKIDYILALKCDINAVDEKGRNVLGWAGLCGNLEVFKHLVDKGADIYAKDKYKRTSLMYAVSGGNKELIDYLIDNKLDINAVDRNNESVIMFSKSFDVAKHLVSKGAKRRKSGYSSSFFYAKTADEVRKLILDGYDVNYESAFDRPITRAKNREVAEVLYEFGADIDCEVGSSGTPLCHHIADNRLDVAQFLIEKGVRVDFDSILDGTPLKKAVRNGNLEAVKMLINAGADVNYVSFNSPVILFGYIGGDDETQYEIIKELIKAGADVNRFDGQALESENAKRKNMILRAYKEVMGKEYEKPKIVVNAPEPKKIIERNSIFKRIFGRA